MRSNGEAIYAFFELQGLKYEATERYEGKKDSSGRRTGIGSLYRKAEGYAAKEKLVYRGGWKNDVQHGQGTLFWEDIVATSDGSKIPQLPSAAVIAAAKEAKDSVSTANPIRYVCRFRNGMLHGRGTEFDNRGEKTYVGTFRDGKKEGRGVAYSVSNPEDGTVGGTITYKGEYSQDKRHGFGVAYFAEGHRYLGRFETGSMSGIGLYVHPHGERYEGMFYSDKPDGPGSFYQKDPVLGKETASHAHWQLGRKQKELTTPFEPNKSVDLPDESMNENSQAIETAHKTYSMSAADMFELEQIVGSTSSGPDTDENHRSELSSETTIPDTKETTAPEPKWKRLVPNPANKVGGIGSKSTAKSGVLDLKSTFKKPEVLVATSGNPWKLSLAKYVRLTSAEMKEFGIVDDSSINGDDKSAGKEQLTKSNNSSNAGSSTGDGLAMDEEMIGIHFLEIPVLYVMYVYVCTAAKIFETRATTREFQVAFPDFAAVYQCVIDIIEDYNDSVDRGCKAQQDRKMKEMMSENYKEQEAAQLKASGGGGYVRTLANSRAAAAATADRVEDSTGSGVEAASTPTATAAPPLVEESPSTNTNSKRLMFMSEAEKKQDMVLRQRAELAAKKTVTELDPRIMKPLSEKAIADLESELLHLINGNNNSNNSSSSSDSITEGDTMSITSNNSASSVVEKEESPSDAQSASVAVSTNAYTQSAAGVAGLLNAQSDNEYASELLYILRTAKPVL